MKGRKATYTLWSAFSFLNMAVQKIPTRKLGPNGPEVGVMALGLMGELCSSEIAEVKSNVPSKAFIPFTVQLTRRN